MIKALILAVSVVATNAAFGQGINTFAVAQEAEEVSREAYELSQLAGQSFDLHVRELSRDASQLAIAANRLDRAAVGICGRAFPDYLILNRVEQTCALIEQIQSEIEAVAAECDPRLLEIAAALSEANRGLHEASGLNE